MLISVGLKIRALQAQIWPFQVLPNLQESVFAPRGSSLQHPLGIGRLLPTLTSLDPFRLVVELLYTPKDRRQNKVELLRFGIPCTITFDQRIRSASLMNHWHRQLTFSRIKTILIKFGRLVVELLESEVSSEVKWLFL